MSYGTKIKLFKVGKIAQGRQLLKNYICRSDKSRSLQECTRLAVQLNTLLDPVKDGNR